MLTKPNALVYVRRNDLIVTGKHITPAQLSFPTELLNNLEVVDTTQFVSVCQQFFDSHELSGKRVIVVLGTTATFEKTIELDKTGKPSALTQAFIDAMPLEKGLRACVSTQSNNKLQLYATNAALYQAIAEALRLCGIGKLMAITPASAYGLTGTDLSLETIAVKFMDDTSVQKQANFAKVAPL